MECLRAIRWKCIESETGDYRYHEDGQVWTGRRTAIRRKRPDDPENKSPREPHQKTASVSETGTRPQGYVRLVFPRTTTTPFGRHLAKSRDERSLFTSQSRTSKIIFAIRRSMMVSGIDLFAKRAKLSLFFSLFRMLSATMFDAVPMGVAIPPIPVPTASAQANGAIETPGKLDIAAMTGMKTVTNGTLSTI